jgi:hypothetical protein
MNDSLIQEVMQKRLDLRDQLSILKKEFDEKAKKLKSADEKLEMWLLEQMNTIGTTTIKNAAGTAYISTQSKVSCSDWTTFWGWLLEKHRLDLLEKRIAVNAIKTFVQETGELPPTLNLIPERVVNIRRN